MNDGWITGFEETPPTEKPRPPEYEAVLLASDSGGDQSDAEPELGNGTMPGLRGNETAWFDHTDYAGKATGSDAPTYFPGLTPGQTAIAAGVMAGLPAAAILGPTVGPALGSAAVGAYISNPNAVTLSAVLLIPVPLPRADGPRV